MEFRESSESKQKSKRKRQRQERNPDERSSSSSSSSSSDVKQSSQHEKEEAQVLTPHTLRLLKLIQEGSTDHARFSVPQLKAITAGSSPIILWDILGRLLFFLNSPDWRTRHNASLAMEGVAQHLPIMDQQKFLQEESHHVGGEKHLWLTLADLKGKMKVILENGRNLMASSETNYDDQEDEELERLDSTMKGGKDFCEQRIQLQRAILARRLGLSGILGQYSEKNIEGAVTGDDLVPCAEKSSSRVSIKRKYDKDEKPLTKDYVRALLVMEITQQEGSSGIISHENSQRLLAAELIYRMFDASWHVRHGSLMGILALMRAWQAHKSKASFGIWPHDILARSLCVLALDRFGDYSGASMESSGGVVSPVREMAGQVFSVIFQMSPDSVQEECFEILTYLLRDDEWEVRHGALTALKYTAALVIGAFSGRASDRQKNSLSKASTLAIARLEDSSDDVQSVAAHLLSLFFSGGTTDFQSGNEKIIVKIASPLWESLKKTRLVSSCIRDLVCLFSEIITGDCNAVLEAISGGNSNFGIFRQFFTRLNELLECDYISVKCSVVRAIGTIANQLATFCSSTDTEMDEGWSGMIDCFCCIIKSIYNLYFDYSTFSEGTDKDPILETFMKECRQTWRTLAKASGKILTRCNKKRSDLETFLILRYFDLSQRTGMEQKRVEKTSIVALTRASYARNLQLRLALADVLCNFLVEGSVICKETSHDMLELCICSSFESPFTSQCEAACFLFQALSNHFENVPVELNLLECVMQNCTGVLRIMVETSPFCIESSEVLASNPGLSSILFTSLTCGVDMVKNKKECGRTAARAVVNLWKEAISTQTVTAPNFQQVKKSPVTLDSLRLSVSVAGALISGGYRFLPEKLTPLVRALMTSIQSERDELCQITTCSYLSKLLHLLFGTVPVEKIDAYQRTYWKVLKNICNLIRSNVEPGCSAGSRVVGSMVINLSVNKDLKDLEPVWVSLSCLSSCDVNATERNQEALCMMRAVCKGLQRGVKVTRQVIECFLKSLVVLSCTAFESSVREYSSDHVKLLCTIDETFGLSTALPSVVNFLRDSNDSYRLRACILLRDMLDTTSMSICPFVRSLLPISMSLMTDPIDNCAKTAASIFSRLVQVAPLVRQSTSLPLARGEVDKKADLVMDHLIHGKPLPPCELHPTIINVLKSGGVVLRNYQLEGVSWLRFLQTVNLNGALCDSMGLGKTLQALLGVALSHLDDNPTGNPISLVICPSSVVGHWMKEIERFFPDRKVFQALSLAGSAVLRETRWKEIIKSGCNLVITNYAVLRSDVDRLSTIQWNYCVLDEGHLLKNPKTATARASRKLRSRHRLILTGTPVQNKVHEVWATFDFLMPNFLGSSCAFLREFAKPITKGQLPGASALDVANGMERLKVLHQQVLPFILRREKSQVLKELPPKCITTIPCDMSPIQIRLYQEFCLGAQAKKSIQTLQRTFEDSTNLEGGTMPSLGSDVLKSLLYLRLLCTHPSLVTMKVEEKAGSDGNSFSIDSSGKLVALLELLRNAGVQTQELTAADNDTSLMYCNDDDGDIKNDDADYVLEAGPEDSSCLMNDTPEIYSGSKCLIFAQFTHSLDVVEQLVLKRHMPSVGYLRLDGRVPADKRLDVVDMFNNEAHIRVMLLTTKVGGLGLNLTGADTVIFLEHDWNPHVDLQSMDRAHRIGQKKTVNVYKLVTTGSIEEKIMKLQDTKLAMSDAIVNTDNSTLFSMGTDRLLDIFRFRSEVSTGATSSHDLGNTLDALVERYEGEYQSLSVGDFSSGFQRRGETADE